MQHSCSPPESSIQESQDFWFILPEYLIWLQSRLLTEVPELSGDR